MSVHVLYMKCGLPCRFDVRLMQFGRMKGQAFVGLPSERAAIKAVRETNGYVLHGKPMIVVSCDIFYSTSV